MIYTWIHLIQLYRDQVWGKESPTTTATIFIPCLYFLIYDTSSILLRDENVKGRLRKEAKCQKSGQTAHVWIIIITWWFLDVQRVAKKTP